ncbi:MAG TPA: nuclear transport factor 2 family protein [Terriglobales bacterium]|nr:nuclear transport factor 2 family protein [Terriglobales bacterium]
MSGKVQLLLRARSALHVGVLALLGAAGLDSRASAQAAGNEIPLERCDRLPVVKVKVADTQMRFLVDTGATTLLNLKSFAGGHSKQIHISSWRGSADTSAREVSLSSFSLGSHTLYDLKLPAIDLTPIARACGGIIDGLLGVDLLDRMGVTIDLKNQIASLTPEPGDAIALYREMDSAMGHCASDFEQAKVEELEKCFDPEIVLYCPGGEYRGRSEVMRYMREHYFKFAPNLRYIMRVRDLQALGNALWYSYDYEMELGGRQESGHGMAICRKSQGRWMILNMHNSRREPDIAANMSK